MITDRDASLVLAAFQAQGVTTVYLTECCGKRYWGRVAACICRTCKQVPVSTPYSFGALLPPEDPCCTG